MANDRIPDPTLMARLQLSVKGVDWAASLVRKHQHENVGDSWSAHQQVLHLIANEQHVIQPRLKAMLESDQPVLESWDSEAHWRNNYGPDRDIEELAEEFMAERAKTVEMLKPLNADDWFRTATWPNGRVVDVAWVAERALWHALDHFSGLLKLHNDLEPLQAPAWRE
jgi:hypothetical protein